jgi:hypothetical protein
VNLSPDEVATAYHCVSVVMRGFRTAPAPWAVQALYDRLNTEYTSALGQRNGDGTEESTQELCDAAQAARRIGITERQVRRLANDLDGRKCGGVWTFPRQAVEEYAEARKVGRIGPGG